MMTPYLLLQNVSLLECLAGSSPELKMFCMSCISQRKGSSLSLYPREEEHGPAGLFHCAELIQGTCRRRAFLKEQQH